MSIEEYFGEWLKIINTKDILQIIKKVLPLYQKSKISPKYEDIFKAFRLCPYRKLKAVFLGQDPYPQMDVATGLAFGNKKGKSDLSPSLQILKDACTENAPAYSVIDFDETLESWSKQGILLLNSALTVEVGKVGSHMMLWRPFIANLLVNLSKQETGIVYVLFGEKAQTFSPYINKSFNDVVLTKHPAYYVRTHTSMPASLFVDINELIIGKYGKPFKWYNII